MAEGNDDNPNNGPQAPFAYVLIPVLGFGLIVSLITCYRFRRRKRRLARLAAEDGPTFSRDPETGRTRIDRPDGDRTVATGRRRAGRRLGLGVGSREEGLNELGEAPPAYAASAPKPPSIENIELMSYSQATAEIGTSRSPPQYGQDGTGETSRLSQEMRRGPPGNATTSGASDIGRISHELRRHVAGGVTATASGSGDSAGRTNSDSTENARPSQETRRDIPGNTTGDTTATTTEVDTATASATDTTTTAPSTSEPAPPPRAVLPAATN
ncbi:hypothetical protein F4678DRAFT_471945 [Xylaria arbuscula]|nr:hypothetical protein F4678DRAFT_471945 [Xylaria arbuscula]